MALYGVGYIYEFFIHTLDFSAMVERLFIGYSRQLYSLHVSQITAFSKTVTFMFIDVAGV
jgi:hypothetical protein